MEGYKKVVITGASQVGKSTTGNRIVKELPYQIIHGDTLRDTFSRCFPNLGIGVDTARKSQEFQKFLFDYMYGMTYEAKSQYGYVLEAFEIASFAMKKHCKKEDFLFYALGIEDITPEKHAEALIQHRTPHDWIYSKNYEELIEFATGEIIRSREIKQFCEQNKIPFYNMAYNREEVIAEIVRDVKKRCRIRVS